jgi:hypothetical protein
MRMPSVADDPAQAHKKHNYHVSAKVFGFIGIAVVGVILYIAFRYVYGTTQCLSGHGGVLCKVFGFIGKALKWTEKEGEKAWHWTEKAGEKAWHWTEDAGEKAWHWTDDAGKKAFHWTGNAGKKAGHFLGGDGKGTLTGSIDHGTNVAVHKVGGFFHHTLHL